MLYYIGGLFLLIFSLCVAGFILRLIFRTEDFYFELKNQTKLLRKISEKLEALDSKDKPPVE